MGGIGTQRKSMERERERRPDRDRHVVIAQYQYY
jgi:hypothetical protein